MPRSRRIDWRMVKVLVVNAGTSAAARTPPYLAMTGAADVVLPRVGHGLVRGVDVPGHVLAEVEVVDRRPAVVDDEHERVVVREMDVDVVR
jgi:hypothetical protein